MARLNGKFISGALGDAILKKHGNTQVIQAKSKKPYINMTIGTYNSSYIFGRASALACYIRDAACQLISFYDGGMVYRFTGECNKILQKAAISQGESYDFDTEAFSRLDGFEFNINSLVRNQLFIQPIVTCTETKLLIDLPEMKIPGDLKFPTKTEYCALGINVSLFDLQYNLFSTQEIQSIDIKLEHQSYVIPAKQFEFDASSGCLCVVSLGLYYYEKTFAGNAVVNNKSFSPAAILKAFFVPGEPDEGKSWRKIIYQDRKKHKAITKKKKALKRKQG